jgi:heme/copper-type cytochrome/quinol oxidase subunit 2
LAVALVGVVAGLIFAVKYGRGRKRGEPDAHWWALSALILAIPAVGLIILA